MPRNGPTIVYWYPTTVALPARVPSSRQWCLPVALSRHVSVLVLSICHSRRVVPRAIEVRPGLTVIEGAFPFTFHSRHRLQPVVAPVDRSLLGVTLRVLRRQQAIFWLSYPNERLLPKRYSGASLVYDCIDPSLDGPSPHLDAVETRLCKRAGAVFASARSLQTRIRAWGVVPTLLPNGCTDLGSLPTRPTNRRPVVGLLGTVDQRIWLQRLGEVAARLSGFDFVIGGRINPDRQEQVEELASRDNVQFVGPVSDGKAFLQTLDVGMIPFIEDAVGDAINPVKMYTYLERGLPVVATNIRECRGIHEDVIAATGADEFADALVHSVGRAVQARRSERREFALGHTWNARATTAVEHLSSLGIL